MTVRNTNYSSLEEVWGDAPASSKPRDVKDTKRKERRDKRERTEQPTKVTDPICELYEMGNYRGYNENDIIHFANEYHDKYLEKENSRGYTKYIDDEDDQQDYQQEYNQDRDDIREPPKQFKSVGKNPEQAKKTYRPIIEEPPIQNEFAFIDLLLYIVSGIILIFVMEQFVKIGLLLQ